MRTVVETPTFTRQCDKIFSLEEKRELIDFLANNPLAGDEIAGTGGVRKVRFAASGRGKRGGARIVYYYLDDILPIYALLAYTKNVQTDLTPEEKAQVSAFVDVLKASRRRKQ
jgi:mRNA-degrading endonuclease RelE of RelBE toxin-antitoxin system